MAALSLHYITLRSRQIGLHLQPSTRGEGGAQLILFGWILSELCFPAKIGLCLNEVDEQKVSDFFFFACNKSRLGFVYCCTILLNPARCIRLSSVSIDPSELYHVVQSSCPPAARVQAPVKTLHMVVIRQFAGFH